MFKCLECGALFVEPKQYSEDLTPGGAFEGGSFIRSYNACPNCGGEYEEVKQCDECGGYFTDSELIDTSEYIDGHSIKCCKNCRKEDE